jgi:hypothetical protein
MHSLPRAPDKLKFLSLGLHIPPNSLLTRLKAVPTLLQLLEFNCYIYGGVRKKKQEGGIACEAI